MNFNHKMIFLIIILIMLSSLSTAAQAELVFGVPAKKAGIDMYEAWLPIIEQVEEISGLKINLTLVKDHEKLSHDMKLKKIDFGYFSPIPYVMAQEKINCKAIVMRVKYGSPYYKTGFIVKTDSPIDSIDDLYAKTLALTNQRDSTSGYFVPLAMLKEADIDPENDLQNIIYSGKHINVLKTVSFGIADVGAVKLYILEDSQNEKYVNQIKVIALSHFLPGSAVAVRQDLSEAAVSKLKNAFLDISLTKEGREALAMMNFNGFVQAEHELYRIIYRYLESAEAGEES